VPTQRFAQLVSLACHDLRTPLATVNGFAKTLTRGGMLQEREAHFVELIESAADQMTGLLDLLGLAARIESERYEPALAEADTFELATSADERIATEGSGETIETDATVLRRSLEAMARSAAAHGPASVVTWSVAGRELRLTPLTEAAAPIVTGESPRDLGALVARRAIEFLGGAIAVDGDTLLVRL
jgi:signal transduction histidine kinase